MTMNRDFTTDGACVIVKKFKEVSAINVEIVIVEGDPTVGALYPYSCDDKLGGSTGLLGKIQESWASHIKIEST